MVGQVALAEGDFDKLSHRRMNGQVQRHSAVTAMRVGERLHVVARFGVNLIIPSVTSASRFREISVIRGKNGEMQRHRAVTPIRCRESSGIVPRSRQRLAIPLIFVTCRHIGLILHRMIHRQIQRHDAVATVGRTTFKRISGCVVVGCVGISIYPSIGIARSLNIRAINCVHNRQIQRHNTVATVRSTTFKRVSSCVVIGCIGIPIYPSIEIAGSLNIRAIARSRYRKIEYDNAVAAQKGGQSVVVNARFRIGFSLPSV